MDILWKGQYAKELLLNVCSEMQKKIIIMNWIRSDEMKIIIAKLSFSWELLFFITLYDEIPALMCYFLILEILVDYSTTSWDKKKYMCNHWKLTLLETVDLKLILLHQAHFREELANIFSLIALQL